MALLTYQQQQAIKPISGNREKFFAQQMSEVESIYLPRLLGEYLAQQVIATPLDYVDLLDGSTFVYCGNNYTHKGLRYCLAYYFYAEYIKQSDVADTFTGLVSQNRGETTHLSNGRIKQLEDYFIKIADSAFELVKKYICVADLQTVDKPLHSVHTPKMYNI